MLVVVSNSDKGTYFGQILSPKLIGIGGVGYLIVTIGTARGSFGLTATLTDLWARSLGLPTER